MSTMTSTTTIESTQTRVHRPDPAYIRNLIAKRSFITLASTSPSGHAHVAGVLYELVDNTLYFHTMRSSRKARNIASNHRVAACLPVRRLPVGPPSIIQFQTTARLISADAPEILELVDARKLRSITGHGELEEPDGCFVGVQLPRRVLTHGLGMSLIQLIKAPLEAGGEVTFEEQRG